MGKCISGQKSYGQISYEQICPSGQLSYGQMSLGKCLLKQCLFLIHQKKIVKPCCTNFLLFYQLPRTNIAIPGSRGQQKSGKKNCIFLPLYCRMFISPACLIRRQKKHISLAKVKARYD
jgi:hypothetical protein